MLITWNAYLCAKRNKWAQSEITHVVCLFLHHHLGQSQYPQHQSLSVMSSMAASH